MEYGGAVSSALWYSDGTPRSWEALQAYNAMSPADRAKQSCFDLSALVRSTLDLGEIPVCGIAGLMVRTAHVSCWRHA